jgi:anaerobic magnesium-protoporphyrin IX monomethyl ester cyclase
MTEQFKKFLFVIPSYSHAVIDLHSSPVKVVPFGILSLASYINKYCPWVECKILDFNVTGKDRSEQYASLKTMLLEFKPDIVGLSAMYNACRSQIAPLVEIIKAVNPNTTLVVGGIMATNMAHEIFNESPLIDAICFGEGEIPVRDLLASPDSRTLFQEHPSWIMNNAAGKSKKPVQSFVNDLDDIPPIQYHLVNGKEYTSQFRNRDGEDGLALPVHSTRGCPFNCVFCCSAANHGRRIRSMSASRFLQDVEHMIKKYKITRLSIDDDQFLFHRKRAKEILTGLAGLDIEIEMANGLTVRFIDDEMAYLLKRAGLKIAVLAIESGSQRVLKEIIGKPLNLDEVSKAVKALRKQDLSIHSFFIIGFPGETDEDRKCTRDFIVSTGFDWNGIFIATPFPGSRLFELCRDRGYISLDHLVNPNIFECQITAPGVDPETITQEAYLLNLDANFVNNYNMAQGFYQKAVSYFSGIAKRYPTHAFVHYFIAKALQHTTGTDHVSIKNHYHQYEEIISSDSSWKGYAEFFKLPEAPGRF